jgi:hypothetical protein
MLQGDSLVSPDDDPVPPKRELVTITVFGNPYIHLVSSYSSSGVFAGVDLIQVVTNDGERSP